MATCCSAEASLTPIALPSPPQNAVDIFNARGGQVEATAMMEYKVDEQKAKVVVVCQDAVGCARVVKGLEESRKQESTDSDLSGPGATRDPCV